LQRKLKLRTKNYKTKLPDNMIKETVVAVAAFAVTATGASAFTGDMLEKVDLDFSEVQIAALGEAHELRQAGADKAEMKEVLEAAGLERADMQELKAAVREVRSEQRAAVRAAIEAEDYEAFLTVVGDRVLAQAINSEADFILLVEANELREAGEKEEAKAIMAELGIERPEGHKGGERGGPDSERERRGA